MDAVTEGVSPRYEAIRERAREDAARPFVPAGEREPIPYTDLDRLAYWRELRTAGEDLERARQQLHPTD